MYLLDPASFLLYLAAHNLTDLDVALRLRVRYCFLWYITHQQPIPSWDLAMILYGLRKITGIWYSQSSMRLVQNLNIGEGSVFLSGERFHLPQQAVASQEGGR